MQLSTRFQKFILGKEDHQFSDAEFKRIMVTGYLATLSLTVAITYAIFDVSSGVYYALPSYTLLTITSISVFFSIRNKKYALAKILLMVNSNLVVFFSAVNDPQGTGAFMLFIPAGTGSFAIFGFRERIKPILIAIFSIGLFVIAFFVDLPFNNQTPTENYIMASFIINFVISLGIVVGIVYFLGSLNETTEKNLIEKEKAERTKNDQLVKINNELDRFIYSVSHDLKSPLSSIRGLVSIGVVSSEYDEMKKCFALIEDRVKAQEFFINEIIDIYRNNRSELRLENVDLQKLFDEVVHETSFEPGANMIQFKITTLEPIAIEADQIRLKSILFNLIGNAIKYHDYSKTEKVIHLSAKKINGDVEIIIEDNGKGIDETHLPLIFNMFYRASTDSKGSGLGLYIVKEIVTKMNGSISVTSKINEGTRFIIVLTT
jgi:signal transduction histidine kinase